MSIESLKLSKQRVETIQVRSATSQSPQIPFITGGFAGGPFLPGSLSKDSGLDFDGGQPGSVDPLAGGLNSMGLGGRGFPAYGNQGMSSSSSWILQGK